LEEARKSQFEKQGIEKMAVELKQVIEKAATKKETMEQKG
jgi:hypothetical protein